MLIEKPHEPIRLAVNRFMVPAVVCGDLKMFNGADEFDCAAIMTEGETFSCPLYPFQTNSVNRESECLPTDARHFLDTVEPQALHSVPTMITFPAALSLALLTLIIGLAIRYAAGRQVLLRASMGEALVANSITSHFTRPHVLLNNVTLPTVARPKLITSWSQTPEFL